MFSKSISSNINDCVKSQLLKDLADRFINEISCENYEDFDENYLKSESLLCKQIHSKTSLSIEELVRILVNTHTNIVLQVSEKWRNHSEVLSKALDSIKDENQHLTDRLIKTQDELDILKTQKYTSNKQNGKFHVFRYEQNIAGKFEEELAYEQNTSILLSVGKEESFVNTLDSIELKTNFNESCADNFSIRNEEPKAKNVYDYNMKHEICFNKLKKAKEEEEFNDVSEKSYKYDISSNLQANMSKFSKYHIGRNKNMNYAKSASIANL